MQSESRVTSQCTVHAIDSADRQKSVLVLCKQANARLLICRGARELRHVRARTQSTVEPPKGQRVHSLCQHLPCACLCPGSPVRKRSAPVLSKHSVPPLTCDGRVSQSILGSSCTRAAA